MHLFVIVAGQLFEMIYIYSVYFCAVHRSAMRELTLYYYNVVLLIWRLDSCLSSGVSASDVSCTSVRDWRCAVA